MECVFACMGVHWCRSTNFKIAPRSNGLHACQLISSEQFAGKEYMEPSKAYNHYSVKNPCQEKPCHNGGKCVLQENRQHSHCECKKGFGGENCEKVHGNWSSWKPWESCSVKCGGGSQSRSRTCTSPAPANGGDDCTGNDKETRKCNPSKCSPKNCAEVLQNGYKQSGEYDVYPDDGGGFKVYCDQKTAGGGWTVFQRRKDGSVDFSRGWVDYKNGFGDLNGEFWLGLDKIHRLTHQTRNRLRVEIEDTKGKSAYAEYDLFDVTSERNKYKLSLGTYSGTAGDSLSYHRNMAFSTKDRDNDKYGGNCAASYKAAWWYNSCHYSNLNGQYKYRGTISTSGVHWYYWKNSHYSLARAEMKMRPQKK
ncbi:techylectin-5B [Exaiptasia diaphana]|uniref:Uncharacterized protein n=1 Tax=Exaiptasia diaphana TaxID=2652724 RepID=A0A913X6P8_EXADI|nr:techylectin-5B [Exaiptasia diaphana]